MEQSLIWNAVFGNEMLKSSLSSDISVGRLAHAYILEGPHGSGKTLLALTVCAVLSGESDMADRIFMGGCPDVVCISLPPDRKTIGVDAVRTIRAGAYIKPNDLDFRAYLIENCDAMTVQAQNALLKLLEEPPKNVCFFLMCENASALLPTVRSRAPTLRMQTFEPDELVKYLIKTDSRARIMENGRHDELAALALAAGGSIGRAKELLEGGAKKDGDAISDVLDFVELLSAKDLQKICAACLALPSKRDVLSDFYFGVRVALRDIMAIRCASETSLLLGADDRLRRLSGLFSQARLMQLEDAFADQLEKLRSNINLQNSKIALFSAISSARYVK